MPKSTTRALFRLLLPSGQPHRNELKIAMDIRRIHPHRMLLENVEMFGL